jgi:hypothetical protein
VISLANEEVYREAKELNGGRELEGVWAMKNPEIA